MFLFATPHPAITQERGQVGVANQEFTKESVSQHCESEMAYSYSPRTVVIVLSL